MKPGAFLISNVALAGIAAVSLVAGGVTYLVYHPKPRTTVGPNITVDTGSPELSAAAIGAGRGCGGGSLVINNYFDGVQANIGSAELKKLAQDFSVSTELQTYPSPIGGARDKEISRVFGDPQTVVLNDGHTLMALRQTFRGYPFERTVSDNSPIPSANVENSTVFDSWDEYLVQTALAANQTVPSLAAEAQWKLAHRLRGVETLWTSTDCGKTWTYHSGIDSLGLPCAKEFNDPASAVKLGNGTTGNHYFPGGMDRTELTADPWSGDVYMSARCGDTTLLYRLPAGAPTWTPIDSSTFPHSDVPVEMTTTKSGALWLFSCDRTSNWNVPELRRSADHGASFTVVKLQNSPADSCGWFGGPSPYPDVEKFAAGMNYNVTNGTIARAGDDAVRIAWPRNDLQFGPVSTNGQYIYTFGVSYHSYAGSNHTYPNFDLEDGQLLTPVDADAVMFHPAFVEYSDTIAIDHSNYDGILYWQESSPSTGKMRTRMVNAKSTLTYVGTRELSEWTPPPGDAHQPGFLGDYVKGAAYCGADHMAHFRPIWGENSYEIHYVDVTSVRKCGLPQVLTAKVPVTPGAPSMASTSPTVLSSRTSLTTKSSTTATTASATTTAVPGSTTTSNITPQQGFRVTSISVSMNDCVLTHNQYVCGGTGTFHLNSGVGGLLTWSAHGTLHGNCTDNAPFSQPQKPVTVKDGDTTVSAPVQLVFPSSEDPNANDSRAPASTVIAQSGSVSSTPTPFYDPNGCSKP